MDRNVHALKDLNLEIMEGEIFGYLDQMVQERQQQ